MDNDELCELTNLFELNEEDMDVKRVSLDMWSSKSCKDHKRSMSVNKFYKHFRISLLKIIVETLREMKIDIMVYAGTALAVWRDNGTMIPHDHDIDLAISETDYLKVHKALNERQEIFTNSICPFTQNDWFNDESEQILYNQVGIKRFKVYFQKEYLEEMSKHDKKTRKLLVNYDMTKLFIDIFTLQKKPGTNVYRVTWNIPGVYDNDKKCFPEEVIFPLKEYLFEGISVLGPRDIHKYLEIEYGYLEKDARYDPSTQLYVKLNNKEMQVLPSSIRNYMST